jgi:hypothetical protein
MNPMITRRSNFIRRAFWRTAAELTGWAVRHKDELQTSLSYAPFVLAGALAYLLGRLVGAVLLNGIPV